MKATIEQGLRLYKSKKYDKALDVFLKVEAGPDEYLTLAYYLGLCYTRLEEYDDALLYLEQVVTSDSNMIHVYQSRMLLSYIYAVTGRHKLAEYELNTLKDSGYDSVQVLSALGYVAYMQGKVDESVEHLEEALGLENRNPNAMNSLGYILADSGRDMRRAIRLCKDAVTLNPYNPAYLDSLGWALYNAGSLDDAMTYLKKAADLARNNKDIQKHYKEALAKKRGR
ncbi:MAG: tetratricopeptide repeat protein [Spirochaetia bacterium]